MSPASIGERLVARPVVRTLFLLFFMKLGWDLWGFYLWATGQGPHVVRPDGFAGIIPVGAFMSFFLWLKTGIFDEVQPAGIVIIIGALLTSLLFKRGFCGWICPVGGFWQLVASLGSRLLGRSRRAPRRLDLVLRSLRYVLSAAIFCILATVSVQEALSFQQLPYYAVSDIKILSLLMRITPPYLVVAAGVTALCLFFGNVWCRYLCPLGALYGAAGSCSAGVVRRDVRRCIGCGACARVCHAGIPVDSAISVRDAECDGCQDCVRACPAPGALTNRLLGRLTIPHWLWPVLVVGVWLVVYGAALLLGFWRTGLPEAQLAAYVRMLGI